MSALELFIKLYQGANIPCSIHINGLHAKMCLAEMSGPCNDCDCGGDDCGQCSDCG